MSAGKGLSTSLVVNFASNLDSAVLSVEVDSRPDGYNGGATSFRPGDSPAFLIHKTPEVVIREIRVTQGSVQYLGSSIDTEEEWLALAMEKSIKPKYPINTVIGIDKSYGDAVTGYSVSRGMLVFPTSRLSSFHLNYTKKAEAYRVTGTLGDAPIIVFVLGDIV